MPSPSFCAPQQGQALPLQVTIGEAFDRPVQWMVEPLVSKPIISIVSLAPCTLKIPGHGIPDEWLVGMPNLTAPGSISPNFTQPVSTFYRAEVVDADTIVLEDLDLTELASFALPRSVRFYTPQDITGYGAVLEVHADDNFLSPVVYTMSVANSRITLDVPGAAFNLVLTAAQVAALAALPFSTGFYFMTVTSPGGQAKRLLSGKFSVS